MKATQVLTQGTYRNAPIVDTVFPSKKKNVFRKKGLFVTVDASNVIVLKKLLLEFVDNPNDIEYISKVPRQEKG